MTDIWRYLVHHVSSVLSIKEVKALLTILLVALFGEEWLPIHCAIATLFCTDWLLGFSVALMQHHVSSAASLDGVIKGLVYATIILVAAQLGKVELVGPYIGGVLLALIALTESVSVLEKTEVITSTYKLDIPFLRAAIRFLQQRSTALEDDMISRG